MNSADDRLRPRETIYYKSLGYCIYCKKTSELSDEHIIPYWMAGAYVISRASCKFCSKITSRFEGDLSDTTYLPLRTRIKIQSRSDKKKRKFNLPEPKFEMKVQEGGSEIIKSVSANEIPAVLFSPHYPRAGIISGRTPLPALQPDSLPFHVRLSNISGKTQNAKRINGELEIPYNPTTLMRLAAKIAHGALCTQESFRDFEPLLCGSILTGHYVSYFVGSPEVQPKTFQPGILHSMEIYTQTLPPDDTHIYIVVVMHLFCEYGGPSFEVVAARKRITGEIGGFAHYIPEVYGTEGVFKSYLLRAKVTESE